MLVSVPLTLPARATMDEVEPLIVAAGRAAMRVAVQAACRQYERQVVVCPTCGSHELQSKGTDTRRLRTSFGRVQLAMRRVRCEGCGHRFRPAASLVATLGGMNVTAQLREACVLAGSSWPYQTAAVVLRGLCGAQIRAESVRQVTNAAGAAEARRQAAVAARLLIPSAVTIRAERGQAHGGVAAAAPVDPERLLVGLDGGWVPSRDQPGGMEGKVRVVATEVDPVGRHGRHRLVQ